ncbi:MAG TPA: orotidine-5'-phosphate decarboxylase [Polyangiales bacterium]|jgi:orotidine-5'-phosphate decarboxylase|nr:orotidine-5'-phosphate decarboxylase [Polyangiales bacterium]
MPASRAPAARQEAVAGGAARLVFPLDVRTLGDAERWLDKLVGHVGVFKVGLELFSAVGPAAVHAVHSRGGRCFLDLKLHDIPATMAGAVEAATRLEVAYLTVHTSAGPSALRESAKAAEGSKLQLLGVTVLTSLDAAGLEAIGVRGLPEVAVARLAKLAFDSGVRGLVCSPLECKALRSALGKDAVLVTPGVRPAGADIGDQQRVATPAAAIAAGADLIVVGRPIRDSKDPVAAAAAIASEIERAQP